MATIRLEHLSCAFASGTVAVADVSLELASGEFFCLLGPSGSGKSTLLRLLGGYLAPTSGKVWINDHDVTAEPPERRKTGMVFQNYALFPHLSALENVAFGLRVQGVAKKEREARAHEMLDWVGLTHDERARHPAQLSGGQQQRVALARALAFRPSLLMLDEPFANLDRSLRERLREEMREIQRRAGTTAILVTHDRDEALALGDRVAVMDQGRLLQIGTPEQVYRTPGSVTVASFLGHRNILSPDHARACGVEGLVLLWPEKLDLAPSGGLPGVVLRMVFAGSHRVLTVKLDNGVELEAHAPHDAALQADQRITLALRPGAATVIPMG